MNEEKEFIDKRYKDGRVITRPYYLNMSLGDVKKFILTTRDWNYRELESDIYYEFIKEKNLNTSMIDITIRDDFIKIKALQMGSCHLIFKHKNINIKPSEAYITVQKRFGDFRKE